MEDGLWNAVVARLEHEGKTLEDLMALSDKAAADWLKQAEIDSSVESLWLAVERKALSDDELDSVSGGGSRWKHPRHMSKEERERLKIIKRSREFIEC